jgi:hypothetical protein
MNRTEMRVFYIPDAASLETVGLGSLREYFPDLRTIQLLLKPLCSPSLRSTLALTLYSMRNKEKAYVLFLRHQQ